MINIEKNVETALYKSAYQGLKIEFEPLRGKPFHITSLDLVEGSFKIIMASTSTNNMQIGNMSANDLCMELMNPTDSWGFGKFDDVYFCGATMRLKLLVYDQTQDIMTETPFGVYIIDNQPRALDTIKITAFNNVIRLDTPFKASDLPTSMTLYDLVDKGLEKAGLAHDDSIQVFPSNALGILDVTKIKSEQVITWRQVIKWCCECVGVNAISDENGIIKFVFYDKYTPDVLRDEDDVNLETEDGEILLIDDTPTTDFQLTPALRYADNSSEVAEEDVVITGFQFKVDDVLYPEDAVMDYGLQSENNLVFYALNERGRIKMAKDVNEKLAGFTYRPFKCNMLSFPHLQTCDSVTYIKDGKQYHSIITDIVYKLNGDMTLTAKGKNKEQKAWEVLGALTPKQQAIIDSVSRKVDKTREQLSGYENALLLFNEKMLHSMGLYKTIKDDPNGGIITYFHNMETLENSDTIYMFGASGFAWTTEGWNDGNPVWHYGFTSTGDAILNTIHAYKLSAELIETGYLRSQNGASWISLDDGTFCFRSAEPDGIDADTLELMYKYEEKLSLDDKGELGVYGTLRSTKYTDFSVFVGPSEESRGAFTVKYDREGFGDLFQVYGAFDLLGRKGAVWTAPFVSNGSSENRISVFPEEISMNSKNFSSVRCGANGASITNGTGLLRLSKDKDGFDEAMLTNGHANIGVYRDSIRISNGEQPWVWFNYWEPYGYYVNSYHFGSGYNHEHSQIFASKIGCGYYDTIETDDVCAALKGSVTIGNITKDNFYYTNYALSVFGKACVNGINVTSDPELKKNITEVTNLKALSKILNMKFYSYDYKSDETLHVDIGTMAPDSPAEIQSSDGKAIDLYAYINLTTKAVQELSQKVEEQAKEIAELKAAIEVLKQ